MDSRENEQQFWYILRIVLAPRGEAKINIEQIGW